VEEVVTARGRPKPREDMISLPLNSKVSMVRLSRNFPAKHPISPTRA
jgi:hypothetical protein